FRDFNSFVLGALRFIVPDQALHRDDVHDTFELIFQADGDLNSNGIGAKAGNDRIERTLERSAGAVEFVNKANAGNAIFVSLTPNGFALWFYAGNTVKHGDCAI